MARPPATILLSTEIDDYTGIEVLSAQALYAVLYNDQPINLKNNYWTERGEFNKYTRATYTNKKPAENLAEKLNRQFFTDKFSVKKIL